MPFMPPFIPPTFHSDPESALAQVRAIYGQQIGHLREAMQRFVAGESLPGRVRASYPYVRIRTETVMRQALLENSGVSYGFVAGAGVFETTLTRPDLYGNYYLEQLHRLRHYTGSAPDWFQNFVLFTNYQFYIDEFVKLGHEEMSRPDSEYLAFVEPGNVVTRRMGLQREPVDGFGAPPPRLPQMPAY